MKAVPVKWTSGWSSLLLKITWRIESQSAVSLASFCLSKTRVKMMRYDVPFQAAWTYAIPDRSLISQATPFLFNRSLDRKGDSTVILSQCLQPSCKFQDVMHSQRVLCAEGMGGVLGGVQAFTLPTRWVSSVGVLQLDSRPRALYTQSPPERLMLSHVDQLRSHCLATLTLRPKRIHAYKYRAEFIIGYVRTT